MALLSRFEVDGATNSVKWTSRYLQSKAYEYARHENSGLLYNEFGTAAGVGLVGRAVSLMRRGVLKGGTTDNACVSVVPTSDVGAVCLSEPQLVRRVLPHRSCKTLDTSRSALVQRERPARGCTWSPAHPFPVYKDGFVNVATALFPVPKYTVYTLDGNFQHPRRICENPPRPSRTSVGTTPSLLVESTRLLSRRRACIMWRRWWEWRTRPTSPSTGARTRRL